jgi:putative SbcD/Mre11-related phosphoesterase
MFTLLMPYPAALIKTAKTKTLVIADPHLGWEMSLQEKGIHVPSQTQKILKKLLTLVSKYKPDALIILGDVKYTVMGSKAREWRDIPEFFNKIKTHVSIVGVVRGNHDANLEVMLHQGVTIHPASGIVVDDVGLFHGHKWPSPELLACKTLVMGHLHPTVVFRDPTGFKLTQRVWMKAICDTQTLTRVLLEKNNIKIKGTPKETLENHYNVTAKTTQLFMMPSFNDFLGGNPINETRSRKEPGNEELIGPVLRSEAVDVDNSEIYLTDGTYLGTLNQIRKL